MSRIALLMVRAAALRSAGDAMDECGVWVSTVLHIHVLWPAVMMSVVGADCSQQLAVLYCCTSRSSSASVIEQTDAVVAILIM